MPINSILNYLNILFVFFTCRMKCLLYVSLAKEVFSNNCAVLQQRGKVFTFLACASCLDHPKYVEQVGGKQEPHSALCKKIQAERKHPAERSYTHTPQPSAGSSGSETGSFSFIATHTHTQL